MAVVMICAQSAQVEIHDESGETPDRLEWVRAERTTAHADHPVVVNYPHLWRPLPINYPTYATGGVVPADTEADLQTGEVVLSKGVQEAIVASMEETPEPSAKNVRAWAAEAGIDVNAKGPIPADVVEQYKASQAEQD